MVTAAAEIDTGHVSRAYRRYVMGLLLCIYIINFLDRQVVNILAELIKNDLNLADWQLGLMGGLAFALLYTILGLPIAVLAERKDRSVIIAIAVTVWSACTAACGLAQNFVQLVLARVGVGVGEAGCTPPAHSLIIDYAEKSKRGSALALYGMGAPLGGLLGMAFGGVVADAYGWRMAFFLAGVPGLLFAALAYFTLKDPRNAQSIRDVRDNVQMKGVTIRASVVALAKRPSYYWCTAGVTIKAFVSVGYSLFLASFFLRNHPYEVAEFAAAIGLESMGFLGLTIGLMSGGFGAAGVWLGGQLSDRLGKRTVRWNMYLCIIASLAFIPPLVVVMTAPSLGLALGALAVTALLSNLHYGPGISSMLSVAPPNMRAPASAIQLFIANLVSLGLGPLAVGLLSDTLAASMGSAEGLRWALVLSSFLGIFAAAAFWIASRTLEHDLKHD
ncbi:MAG: MFS transporter [Alphaproteobacteria bacterium]|nr:MFS transporter [Alphaproteobacteria bacterium]